MEMAGRILSPAESGEYPAKPGGGGLAESGEYPAEPGEGVSRSRGSTRRSRGRGSRREVGAGSEILSVGRATRVAPAALRKALICGTATASSQAAGARPNGRTPIP